MKKLIVALFALCTLSLPLMAEDGIYFKAGKLNFTYPFATVNIISLYDFWQGQGLMGLETPVANFAGFGLNVGAITGALYEGAPIVSVNYDWGRLIPNFPPLYLTVGAFYGYDFDANLNMAGVKAAATLHLFD